MLVKGGDVMSLRWKLTVMFSVRPRRTYKGGSRAIQEVADLVDKKISGSYESFFVACHWGLRVEVVEGNLSKNQATGKVKIREVKFKLLREVGFRLGQKYLWWFAVYGHT